MKNTALLLSMALMSLPLLARDISSFDDTYYNKVNEDYKEVAYNKDTEVANLSKTVAYMQRNYEAKVNYLEIELNKTKDRLIEKSLNEEKIQVAIKASYENEINNLRKELASRTRSMLEFQRQIEKLKPDEDTKNLIKINNQLASDLRKSEGQIAVMQLDLKKAEPINKKNIPFETKTRMPASVESK